MLPKSTNGESVVVFYYPKDQVQMGDVTHHVTKSGSDHTSESVNEYSSVAKTVVHMPGIAVLIFTCTYIYMYLHMYIYMYMYLHVLVFTCTCIYMYLYLQVHVHVIIYDLIIEKRHFPSK